MRTNKLILAVIVFAIYTCYSCEQQKVNPTLTLDEVLIPEGYHQIENPPTDAMARLEELRLDNPKDNFYYIQRNDINSDNWIFPQKELKIEFVAYNENASNDIKNEPIGVIVKQIKGDWKDEQFIIVESQPAPQGSMTAFYHYIQENLKYPDKAKQMGIEGKVFVEFIVDENGKLTNVKTIKGLGAGCDDEAVRVIKAAPNWSPALIVDMPVKVRMILPITYKLS